MSRLTSKHFLHAKFVLLSTLVVFCIFGGITGNSSSQAFAQVDESDVKYFSQSDKTIVHSHVSIFESFDIYGTLYDDNNDGNSTMIIPKVMQKLILLQPHPNIQWYSSMMVITRCHNNLTIL